MTVLDIAVTSPEQVLLVDCFGLSVGSASVGLPSSCTADIVLARYLDLVRLLGRGTPHRGVYVPEDIKALAKATYLPQAVVRLRLAALQS